MNSERKILGIALFLLFICSSLAQIQFAKAADPVVDYIAVWSFADHNWISEGGTVNSGRTVRIYAEISNPVEPVSISYGPSEGSLTTETALYESTWEYYYFDWAIPEGATAGLYDVKVDSGVTSETSIGRFEVENVPVINYIAVWSYSDHDWISEGGLVNSGYTIRIYAGISNPVEPVSISYGPTGSLITETALYESTWEYYYFDWAIPSGATAGLYDVKVDSGTASETSAGRFEVVAGAPVVSYIAVWSFADHDWVSEGGLVNSGYTIRIYAGISNPVEPVTISYGPSGGSLTPVTASYESTWEYYYFDWAIPSSATTGLYDVTVDSGVTSVTSTGRFEVENVPVVDYIDACSRVVLGSPHPDDTWISQGGTVTIGHLVRLYAGITNPVEPVTISYGPTGSLTPVTASYESTWDYYYIDWIIPDGTTTGLYDVKVDTGTTSETSPGRFTVAAGLLVDSRFDVSADSTALRATNPPPAQQWYESRLPHDAAWDATQLTLDTNDVGGNAGKKAGLTNTAEVQNTALTQLFSSSQTGTFTLSFDILIDSIQDNAAYDRTGHVFVGSDAVSTTSHGPCGTSNERFVFFAFYDPNMASGDNDLQIMARTTSGQAWATTSAWTRVGLSATFSYDTWYTVKLVIKVASNVYDVYVDGVLVGQDVPRYGGYTVAYVNNVTFLSDSDARGSYYVDNVLAP